MTDLEYLIDTYFNKETWHKERLNKEQAEIFYKRQLNDKNIVILRKDNEPKGYLEIWWLNKRQLARIINQEEFHAFDENLTNGDFVYVASAYIEKDIRSPKNIMRLNKLMQHQHRDRDYVGIIYQNGFDRTRFKFYKKGEI